MSEGVSTGFEVQGRFAGFFRDIFGKRRMALRVAGEEIYLKVPKALRKELEPILVPGEEVVVLGRDAFDGRDARVVSELRFRDRPGCIACPIRVCTKKSCWRNGGKELWATTASAGPTPNVEDMIFTTADRMMPKRFWPVLRNRISRKALRRISLPDIPIAHRTVQIL
jgi:hypothetical protein